MILIFKSNDKNVAYKLDKNALLNIIKTTPMEDSITKFYNKVFDLYTNYLSWDPTLIKLEYHITNIINKREFENYIKTEVTKYYGKELL